ncbi:MAG: hypothetical protein Kow0037_02400 [Calditrichia bacterium]
MKSVMMVLFISLFLTSMVFAQGSNYSETVQTGDDNKATVTQIGSMNYVGAPLTNGSNPEGVYQLGNENEAMVEQVGSKNFVESIQGGHPRYNIGAGNLNIADIYQDGQENQVWGRQLGDENNADIDQVGLRNYATYWVWGNRNTVKVESKNGDDNYAKIAINSSDNSATVLQDGSSNFAKVGQGWIGYANHDGNTAIVDQKGSGNRVENPLPAGSLPGYTSDLVGMGLQQYGENNYGKISQDGTGNKAWTYQFGHNHDITLTQLGSTNDAFVAQYGTSGIGYGDNSSANVTQDGDINLSQNTQIGVDHVITVNQTGNNNTSTILQR